MDKSIIRAARQTNLVSYLLSRGEPLIPAGKNYTHKDHDSLYIRDNMFTWYSRDRAGNSIDFLMFYYGMSFREAVAELTKTKFEAHNEYRPITAEQEKKYNPDERRVIAYLCKKRGLAFTLVESLIKSGKLKQDLNGNCNFVITDWNDIPIGVEVVGTGDPRFKIVTAHSGNGFHLTLGEPTDALYFESAIDLLSCYQIYQDKFTHHVLTSMAGLNSSVPLSLREAKPQLRHWLCVDNDEAGRKFVQEIRLEIQDVRLFQVDRKFKDWNEALKANLGRGL